MLLRLLYSALMPCRYALTSAPRQSYRMPLPLPYSALMPCRYASTRCSLAVLLNGTVSAELCPHALPVCTHKCSTAVLPHATASAILCPHALPLCTHKCSTGESYPLPLLLWPYGLPICFETCSIAIKPPSASPIRTRTQTWILLRHAPKKELLRRARSSGVARARVPLSLRTA